MMQAGGAFKTPLLEGKKTMMLQAIGSSLTYRAAEKPRGVNKFLGCCALSRYVAITIRKRTFAFSDLSYIMFLKLTIPRV
jgi:hypothetical protein